MKRPQLLALAATTGTAVLSLLAAPPAVAGDTARAAGDLVTYDVTLVPAGATAQVQVVEAGSGEDGKTIVSLHVRGLVPNREYGAHAHNLPCGATGAAAGAHYQYVQDPMTLGDPMKASTNPAYANPDNEIWLDFTTNPAGNAVARTVVAWQMPETRRAMSVVVHTRHTDGTGAAGARLACLSVPF